MGRVLFNEILPAKLRFQNEVLDRGRLKALVPATEMWMAYPDDFTVDHPADLAVGANAVALTVSDSGGLVEGGESQVRGRKQTVPILTLRRH